MGNRQLIRGIIFDFDGTLIDSYEAIAESLNHVRSSFSLPDYTVEEVPGPGARRTMRVRRPEATPPPEN